MRWLIGAMVLLPGCFVVVEDGGTGASGSSMVDDPRTLDAFDAITLNGRVDVEASAADEQAVVVHCPGHLIDNVTTDVVNGELQVGDRAEGLFATGWGQCWVEVASPTLTDLAVNGSGDLSASGPLAGFRSAQVNGSGDLTADGIDADTVDLDVHGSGDLRASGSATTLSATLDGSGDLDAGDLHVVNADVLSNGSGDVTITASGTVTVDLNGSGDVRVHGNPEVEVHDHGSGDVVLK